MTVVDSSAIIAILLREPEEDRLLNFLRSEPSSIMSLGNYLEIAIVGRHRRKFGLPELDNLLAMFGVEPVAIDARQAHEAVRADARYGKGSGHPAQLNYGDCFAYALAKVRRAPLLFVGQDFVHTDIAAALV